MSSRPLARLRPAQSVALAFLAFIAGGTLLLMLPISTSAPGPAAIGDAFFTATSAVTVTGLSVVDTASYWSGFGEAVILVLCQLGGLGVMTFTAILVLIISGRLGLRRRQAAQAEQGLIAPGEVRSILIGVAILTAIIESLVALVLFLRFLSLGEGFGRALWYGVFHSVTAFNNAGFALFQDNFMSFSDDWVILGALSVAIIAGGLGLPVWSEIIRRRRTHDRVHRFSLHTRLTLIGTAVLLVLGIGLVLLFEWGNPGTLGPMGVGDKILNGGFQGISPITDFLMFIGAGSVSTSGGIKVTTMLVLAIATIASLRGDREVQLLGRRLPGAAIRVALAVTVVFTSLIALGTLLMVSLTEFGLEQSLFEVTSALSTTGLSTGITSSLPVAGDAILIVLMILGRLGPQVLGASLVLRERSASYHYPEERPIVG